MVYQDISNLSLGSQYLLNSVMRCLPTWARDLSWCAFSQLNITYSAFYCLDFLLLPCLWHFIVSLISEHRVICEEINLYNRGVQSVPCHCTHPIILCRDQALTFRRLPHPRWYISKVTFSQIPQSQGSMTR